MDEENWERWYPWLALALPLAPPVFFFVGYYLFWSGWLPKMVSMWLIILMGAAVVLGVPFGIPALIVGGVASLNIGIRARSHPHKVAGASLLCTAASLGASIWWFTHATP